MKVAMLAIMTSFVLLACSMSDDNSENQPVESGEVMSSQSQSAVNLRNTLIYTTLDGRLYRWDFEENSGPTEIADGIDPQTLAWSPDRSVMIYGKYEQDTVIVMSYDVASNTSTELITIGLSYVNGRANPWYVWNWSPDGEWFVLSTLFSMEQSLVSIGLVSIDGSQHSIAIQGPNPRVLWTNDGRAVVYYQEFSAGPVPGQEVPPLWLAGSFFVYDLTTGAREDITDQIDMETLNSMVDLEQRRTALYDMIRAAEAPIVGPEIIFENDLVKDYHIPRPETFLSEPEFRAVPTFCHEWTIEHIDPDTGDSTVIYEAPDANYLSTSVQLADDSLLFLKFSFPDCEFGAPVGELVRLMPDGTLQVIADELASAADNDQIGGLWYAEERFRVSPDLSHVIWMSFDKWGLESTLNITDLETMASQVIAVNGEPLKDVMNMYWEDTGN